MMSTKSSSNAYYLLVYGYIRALDCLYQVIPDTIKQLCYKYYLANHYVYLMSTALKDNPSGLYVTDIINNKGWKYNIFNLNSQEPMNVDVESWHISSSACCVAKNFCIPQSLIKSNDFLNSTSHYNVIFKIGGYNVSTLSNFCKLDVCRGFIYDSAQLLDNNDKITAYDWNLPELEISGAASVYSSEFGLFVIA